MIGGNADIAEMEHELFGEQSVPPADSWVEPEPEAVVMAEAVGKALAAFDEVQAEKEAGTVDEVIALDPPVLGARLLELNVWVHANGYISVEGLDANREGETQGFGVDLFHSEWQLAARLMELTGKKPKGLVRPWSKTQTIEDWIAAGNSITKVAAPKPEAGPKPKVTLTLEDLGL